MILTPCVTCEFEIDHHSGDYVHYPLRQVCDFLASHKFIVCARVVKRGLRFIVPIGEDQKV